MKAIVIFSSLLAGALAFSDCMCTFEYDPVCGSDGKTYSNMCEFKCAQKKRPSMSLVGHMECGNIITEEASCICTMEYDPVCGSDGKTYSNMCEFKCAQKQRPGMSLVGHMECGDIIMEQASCICTMEYNPVCGSDGKTYGNPCTFRCAQRSNAELTMASHDVCSSPQLNQKHLCICTEEYSPVCGSDGKTYANFCVFKCAQRENSALGFEGHYRCPELPQKADPCVCTREYMPVCGSNGLTYGNACELRCAMSKTPGLKFARNHACDDFIIRASGNPCVCTREYNPVCGSDGLSYGNPCMLRCAMSQKPGLRFVRYGACEDSTPYYPDPCVCTKEFNPVCGSDGLSYGNMCMLRCAMSQKRGLTFVKYGECGRFNALELFASPSCACNKMLRPVCGSDGKTYANPCLFNCAKKQNHGMKIVKQGPCGTSLLQREQQPMCACDRSFEPVCGSDRITYNNLCLFECAQKQKPELTLVKKGNCYNFLLEQESDDCVCSSVRKPVCGSDLKTYDNLCKFECAAKKKPGLKVMYHMVCIIM